MRMEKRSVLSPTAKTLLTTVVSLGVGFAAGQGSSVLKAMSSLLGSKAECATVNQVYCKTVRGLEVSHIQGVVSWDDVRDGGSSFAWIKATEGDSLVDQSFTTNWSASHNAKMYRGAYHVFDSEVDPVAQAWHFAATVGPDYRGDLPPLLELGDAGGMRVDSLAASAKRWMNLVMDSLKVSSVAYWGDPSLLDSLLSNLPPDTAHVVIYGGAAFEKADSWLFRRYADRGFVDGIKKPLPLDIFNGADSAFAQYVNFRTSTTE